MESLSSVLVPVDEVEELAGDLLRILSSSHRDVDHVDTLFDVHREPTFIRLVYPSHCFVFQPWNQESTAETREGNETLSLPRRCHSDGYVEMDIDPIAHRLVVTASSSSSSSSLSPSSGVYAFRGRLLLGADPNGLDVEIFGGGPEACASELVAKLANEKEAIREENGVWACGTSELGTLLVRHCDFSKIFVVDNDCNSLIEEQRNEDMGIEYSLP